MTQHQIEEFRTALRKMSDTELLDSATWWDAQVDACSLRNKEYYTTGRWQVYREIGFREAVAEGLATDNRG